MSEDRTQAASPRRRQAAREQGRAPQSPELTAAAALLGASAALAARGGELGSALLAMVRAPLAEGATLVQAADAEAVAGRLRDLARGVGVELGFVCGAALVAAILTHQAQVRGLWAPHLLAPDVSRLWTPGQGGAGAATRARRGVWSLAKAAVVAAVAAWFLKADWPAIAALGQLEAPDLALAAGRLTGRLGLMLGVATVLLGLADFALARLRFEAMLRMSPEEAREDLRSAEGDPVLRARRRHLARALRGPSVEELAGAALVLTGASGLTVVLAGGPPPRRVSVRAIETGARGDRLRRSAAAAGLSETDAPALALRLARRRPASLPLDAPLLAEVATLWPGAAATANPPRM